MELGLALYQGIFCFSSTSELVDFVFFFIMSGIALQREWLSSLAVFFSLIKHEKT